MYPTLKTCIVLAAAVLAQITSVARADDDDPSNFNALVAQMDTSQLFTVGNISIQPDSLQYDPLAILAPEVAGPNLVSESFQVTYQGPDRITAESTNYVYEWRADSGSFLLTQKEGSNLSRPISGGQQGITTDAKNRITRLGIPASEKNAMASLKVKRASKSPNQPVTSAVTRNKRMVERTIGGIPVLGSRLMLTYNTKPSFRKALGHWPALTADGNVLTTSLTPQQAAEAVAHYLIDTEEGATDGPIVLRYVYMPSPAGAGYIRIRLMIEATLTRTETADDSAHSEKIRVRYVDASTPTEPDTEADES